jgi:hypothetical protein
MDDISSGISELENILRNFILLSNTTSIVEKVVAGIIFLSSIILLFVVLKNIRPTKAVGISIAILLLLSSAFMLWRSVTTVDSINSSVVAYMKATDQYVKGLKDQSIKVLESLTKTAAELNKAKGK